MLVAAFADTRNRRDNMGRTAARQKLGDLEPKINDAARAARIAVLLADHLQDHMKDIGFDIGDLQLLRHAAAQSRDASLDLLRFYYDSLADVED
jgi:hypothetical protein